MWYIFLSPKLRGSEEPFPSPFFTNLRQHREIRKQHAVYLRSVITFFSLQLRSYFLWLPATSPSPLSSNQIHTPNAHSKQTAKDPFSVSNIQIYYEKDETGNNRNGASQPRLVLPVRARPS